MNNTVSAQTSKWITEETEIMEILVIKRWCGDEKAMKGDDYYYYSQWPKPTIHMKLDQSHLLLKLVKIVMWNSEGEKESMHYYHATLAPHTNT